MDKGGGSVYVPVADQVGTIWALADSSAALANSYAYDAFGVDGGASEAVPNRYRFGTKGLDDWTRVSTISLPGNTTRRRPSRTL